MSGLLKGLTQVAPGLTDFQRAIWRGMTEEQQTQAMFSPVFDGSNLRRLGVMAAIAAIEPYAQELVAELEREGSIKRVGDDGRLHDVMLVH